MLQYYDNGKVKVLNHNTFKCASQICRFVRGLVESPNDLDWEDLIIEGVKFADTLSDHDKEILEVIGVDNAVRLCICILQAEEILIRTLESSETYGEHDEDEMEENIEVLDEELDSSINYDQAVIIANLCWNKRISIKDLAIHLNITEKDVRSIRESNDYLLAVEDLILTWREPHENLKWIESYPRATMPSRFGKRMGLAEEVVESLIERIIEKCENG